jgi:hypothetical protein
MFVLPRTRILRAAFAASLALAVVGCASGGRGPRPSPFPEPPNRPVFGAPPEIGGYSSFSLTAFINAADKLRGIPYRLGGASPKTGFDCSGYTQYVYGLFRITLPRTVAEQIRVGRAVKGTSAIKAGDLLFFRIDGKSAPVSHVALAISPTEFLHAPAANGVVRAEKITSPYWRTRFAAVRRVL